MLRKTNKTISISYIRNIFLGNRTKRRITKHKNYRTDFSLFIFVHTIRNLVSFILFFCVRWSGFAAATEDVSHIGNLCQIATTNWTSKWNEFTSVYATLFFSLSLVLSRWHSHKNPNRTYSPVWLHIVDRIFYYWVAQTHMHRKRKSMWMYKNFDTFSMLFRWLATDHTEKWWLRLGIAVKTLWET